MPWAAISPGNHTTFGKRSDDRHRYTRRPNPRRIGDSRRSGPRCREHRDPVRLPSRSSTDVPPDFPSALAPSPPGRPGPNPSRLLFASGRYVIVDEFTKAFVAAGVAKFREVGLEGTVEYFNSPGSDFCGTGVGHRLLQQRRERGRGLVCVHSGQKRQDRRPLPQRDGGKTPQRDLRHGCDRGYSRGQLGDHGGRARLGRQLRRDDVRLRLAQRSRRIGKPIDGAVA